MYGMVFSFRDGAISCCAGAVDNGHEVVYLFSPKHYPPLLSMAAVEIIVKILDGKFEGGRTKRVPLRHEKPRVRTHHMIGSLFCRSFKFTPDFSFHVLSPAFVFSPSSPSLLPAESSALVSFVRWTTILSSKITNRAVGKW
ncbi:unnamed protein product [Sphacelaria rigidula]